jgi:hypothetical protein
VRGGPPHSILASNLVPQSYHSFGDILPSVRTVCRTLVITRRLTVYLPLLICTLDAYNPHSTLFPSLQQRPDIGSALPLPPSLIVNITCSASFSSTSSIVVRHVSPILFNMGLNGSMSCLMLPPAGLSNPTWLLQRLSYHPSSLAS